MHPIGRVFAVAAFAIFSLVGAVAGGGYVIAVLCFSANPARAFAFGLVVAAGIYPVFALFAGAPLEWVALELGGLAAFGALALPALARRRAPGFAWAVASVSALAAGWALHPLWDLMLHASAVGTFGSSPGAAYVPYWYPPVCATFDWAVALACAGLAFRARKSNEAVAPSP